MNSRQTSNRARTDSHKSDRAAVFRRGPTYKSPDKLLDVYVGLHLTKPMHDTLAQEARRAGVLKGPFIRMMLEEGLKSWRFKHLRILNERS